MKKAPSGVQVVIKMKMSRRINYLQQFWAVTNFTYDNLPETYQFKTVDLFVEYVKLDVGFSEVCLVNGKTKEYPRSMSFTACPELEFMKCLYNPALELYGQILGLSRDELINASLEYSGMDYLNKRIQ